MKGNKNILIRFVVDTARASRQMDQFMNKMGKGGVGGAAGGISGLNKMKSLVSSLIPGFGAMGAAGAGSMLKLAGKVGLVILAFQGLKHIIGRTLKFGNLVEGAVLNMELLTGSAEKAYAMVKKSRDFSIRTPFRPAEVLGSTATAYQYGIDPFAEGKYGMKKGMKAMDIFAGLGSFRDISGNLLGIQRMTHAVLRGDYRLLRPVRGIVQPAFEAAKGSGKVGTKAFNEKFIEGLSKIPAIMEAAKKNSESVAGLWSTISGLAQEFWMDFGGAGEKTGVLTFWSQLKEIMLSLRNTALSIYEYISPGITELGAAFGSVFKFILDIFAELFGGTTMLGNFLKTLWQQFRVLIQIFVMVVKFISLIGRFVLKMVNAVADGLGRIFGITDGLEDKMKVFEKFVTYLKIIFMFAEIYITGILDSILDAVDEFIAKFTAGDIWDKVEGIASLLGGPGAGEAIDLLHTATTGGRDRYTETVTTFEGGNKKIEEVSEKGGKKSTNTYYILNGVQYEKGQVSVNGNQIMLKEAKWYDNINN